MMIGFSNRPTTLVIAQCKRWVNLVCKSTVGQSDLQIDTRSTSRDFSYTLVRELRCVPALPIGRHCVQRFAKNSQPFTVICAEMAIPAWKVRLAVMTSTRPNAGRSSLISVSAVNGGSLGVCIGDACRGPLIDFHHTALRKHKALPESTRHRSRSCDQVLLEA